MSFTLSIWYMTTDVYETLENTINEAEIGMGQTPSCFLNGVPVLYFKVPPPSDQLKSKPVIYVMIVLPQIHCEV